MPKECCKEGWNKIPEDEPVFVIRGRDKLAVEVIDRWLVLAEEAGVNKDKLQRSTKHLLDIVRFQVSNPERVKLPD